MVYLTSILRAASGAAAKKAKGNDLLVIVKSTASFHQMMMVRSKDKDKYEFVRYDPVAQSNVLYKEVKKHKTIGKKKGGGGDE